MTKQRIILILVLSAFLALTAAALVNHGYLGIFEPQLKNYAGLQVLFDLVIALSLFLVWMWRDAKVAGRNPWPWLLLTLTLGSISPLIYLIVYKTGKHD